ncbi:MAG: methylated-DNA--[protein]-cysteine S-methyltransferase [Bacteroidota bacterium]
MEKVYHASFLSGIGTVYVASTNRGVCKISIPAGARTEFFHWIKKRVDGAEVVESVTKNEQIIEELRRYFEGKPVQFRSRLDPRGTDFQVAVWSELQKIPYGAVITYKELARRVGTPAGFQAVGRANATNPLPIVIPCHRVLGSNHDLVGYGAGIKTKEYLLQLEGSLMI